MQICLTGTVKNIHLTFLYSGHKGYIKCGEKGCTKDDIILIQLQQHCN